VIKLRPINVPTVFLDLHTPRQLYKIVRWPHLPCGTFYVGEGAEVALYGLTDIAEELGLFANKVDFDHFFTFLSFPFLDLRLLLGGLPLSKSDDP